MVNSEFFQLYFKDFFRRFPFLMISSYRLAVRMLKSRVRIHTVPLLNC